jgi:hypothetical protein
MDAEFLMSAAYGRAFLSIAMALLWFPAGNLTVLKIYIICWKRI